jgi:two-component system, OmpR family, phosphate regulon response regulator PhoB
MLTARGAEGDRIRGLDSGADDYVVKPFSPSELVARLRAMILRTQPSADDELLRYADVAMELAAHRVSRAANPIHLGPTVRRLLRDFLQNPKRTFSREQLLDRVWAAIRRSRCPLSMCISGRLRKALNGGGGPDLLRAVRSVGYALDSRG